VAAADPRLPIMAATSDRWRSRIVGTGEEDPRELRANPANWRRHPDTQRAALGEVMSEVGWVTQVIKNVATGHLVDGHLRVEEAAARNEPTVPVTYVELSEEEERLVLATLDPIGAIADADTTALQALVETLSLDGELDTLLASLLPPLDEDGDREGSADLLQKLSVSLADPEYQPAAGDVWRVGRSYLCVVSIYDGWPTYTPLLADGRLLVPYPTPIVALTQPAELVMVQPDEWLAGHLLDKYAELRDTSEIGKLT